MLSKFLKDHNLLLLILNISWILFHMPAKKNIIHITITILKSISISLPIHNLPVSSKHFCI